MGPDKVRGGVQGTCAGVAVSLEAVIADAAEGAGHVDTGRVRRAAAVVPQTLVVV